MLGKPFALVWLRLLRRNFPDENYPTYFYQYIHLVEANKTTLLVYNIDLDKKQ